VGEECGEQGLGRGAAGRRLVTQAAQMLCIGVAGAGEKEFFSCSLYTGGLDK